MMRVGFEVISNKPDFVWPVILLTCRPNMARPMRWVIDVEMSAFGVVIIFDA